jgi:hypothetical protein
VQAIKALLIIMGVFIVAGFGLLGFLAVKRASDPAYPRTFAQRWMGGKPPEVAAHEMAAPANAPSPSANRQPIILPPGVTLLPGTMVSGSLLIYNVRHPDGRIELHSLDLNHGASTLLIAPATP